MKRARPRFDFSQLLPVVVATSFAAVLTLLLTLGIQPASQLQSASAALQLASELRSLPQYFGTELTLVQRGLEARTFVGEPLADITTAQDGFDKALMRIDADLKACRPRRQRGHPAHPGCARRTPHGYASRHC